MPFSVQVAALSTATRSLHLSHVHQDQLADTLPLSRSWSESSLSLNHQNMDGIKLFFTVLYYIVVWEMVTFSLP